MRRKMLWVEPLERRDLLAALGSGSVAEPVQAQECMQVQECGVECPGPVQEQMQTQQQPQLQQQDGPGPGPMQDQTQERTQVQQQGSTGDQDGDCNQPCAVNDAAIESLVADDADPLRQRSGDTAHPENGNFIRQRDGTSW